MLTRLGHWARERARRSVPWTNVYGLARTLLALGTGITLTFTPTAYLFEPASGVAAPPICDGAAHLSAFCVVPHDRLEAIRWLAVAALLVVASGWRPRFTAPIHWWIAFSLQNSGVVLDGGDQVTLVLTTLMLPLALTDRRRWHWSRPSEPTGVDLPAGEEMRRLVGLFGVTLMRIQVCAIYFHAAIGKFGVAEWTDGTAVYYYFRDPGFGAARPVLALMQPLLANPVTVCAICWGTLALEYLLSTALLLSKKHWKPLLVAGIGLHAAIVVVHGLVSFGLAMVAALLVYLRPFEQTFALPRYVARIVGRVRALNARLASSGATAEAGAGAGQAEPT
jgi:antimicrobial peptide system SdpB family protein